MIKDLFFHSPIRYIVSLVITIGVLITYNCINGWEHLINYSNAFFIGGGFVIALGLFSLLDFYGFFNIARYMFVKKNPDGTKKSLYEYSEERTEKIKYKKFRYVPYLFIGVVVIIVSATLLIINSSIYY